MTDYVIHVVAFANPVSVRGPMGSLAASHLDRFLVHYDPTDRDPERMIVTTADPTEARGFETPMAAFECWTQEHGTRPDGRPNRPLTGYTVEITRRSDAVSLFEDVR